MRNYIKLLSVALLVGGAAQVNAMEDVMAAELKKRGVTSQALTGRVFKDTLGGTEYPETAQLLAVKLKLGALEEASAPPAAKTAVQLLTDAGFAADPAAKTAVQLLTDAGFAADSATLAVSVPAPNAKAARIDAERGKITAANMKAVGEFTAALVGTPALASFLDLGTAAKTKTVVNGVALVDAIFSVLNNSADLKKLILETGKSGDRNGEGAFAGTTFVQTDVKTKLPEVLTALVAAEYAAAEKKLEASKDGKGWKDVFTNTTAIPPEVIDELNTLAGWQAVNAAYAAVK